MESTDNNSKMLFVFLLCLILPTLSIAGQSEYYDSNRNCECGNPKDPGYQPYSGYTCSSDCSNSYYGGKYRPVYRYYYNHKRGYCLRFRYYGCGGNSNNFKTLYECRNTCETNGYGYVKYCAVCPRYYGGKSKVKRESNGYYNCKGRGCYGDDCNCKPGYKCCEVPCYNNAPVRRRRDNGGYGNYRPYSYQCVKAYIRGCYGSGRRGLAAAGQDGLGTLSAAAPGEPAPTDVDNAAVPSPAAPAPIDAQIDINPPDSIDGPPAATP